MFYAKKYLLQINFGFFVSVKNKYIN